MKHGEVLGLRWRDIQTDTLRVHQTIVKVGGDYAFSTPKTIHEARALGNGWREEKHLSLVFRSETGTSLTLSAPDTCCKPTGIGLET